MSSLCSRNAHLEAHYVAHTHDILFSSHHWNRMRYFKQNGYDSTEEVKCNANIYAGTQQSGHPPLPVNVTSRASTRWSLRWHIHLEKPSSFQLPTDGGVFSFSICWNFIKSILSPTLQMFPGAVGCNISSTHDGSTPDWTGVGKGFLELVPIDQELYLILVGLQDLFPKCIRLLSMFFSKLQVLDLGVRMQEECSTDDSSMKAILVLQG